LRNFLPAMSVPLSERWLYLTRTQPACQVILVIPFPEPETVNVHLVWIPFWLPDMMSDEAKDELGIY